jgi:WD40 repeat protein
VNSLAFSPAGQLLASGGSDGEVKLWDPSAGKDRGSFDVRTGEVRCVAFAPDGATVAAGVRYGAVRILAVPSLTEKLTLKGHVSDAWSVAFSQDGSLLATGDGDWNQPGEVKLWETATWKEHGTLRHTGEVLCLAFDPKGTRLAAGSWDRTVKVWILPRPPRGDAQK